MLTSTNLGFATVIVAMVSATVAVCLGHIDAQTYATIVGASIGFGGGVGAHASGVTSGAASASSAAGSSVTGAPPQ